MARSCAVCGKAVPRPRSSFCSKACNDKDYRERNLEKVKAQISEINKERYHSDPTFAAAGRKRTQTWRNKAVRRMAGKQKSKDGYRSRMEARIVPRLLETGAAYEPILLRYTGKPRGYTPDVVLPNGVVIEIKGWFTPADRSKMLAVKQQFPALDLRLVLATPNQKLGVKSKTTLAGWCEQHGFPWAADDVPDAWLKEPVNSSSVEILRGATKRKRKGTFVDFSV